MFKLNSLISLPKIIRQLRLPIKAELLKSANMSSSASTTFTKTEKKNPNNISALKVKYKSG